MMIFHRSNYLFVGHFKFHRSNYLFVGTFFYTPCFIVDSILIKKRNNDVYQISNIDGFQESQFMLLFLFLPHTNNCQFPKIITIHALFFFYFHTKTISSFQRVSQFMLIFLFLQDIFLFTMKQCIEIKNTGCIHKLMSNIHHTNT